MLSKSASARSAPASARPRPASGGMVAAQACMPACGSPGRRAHQHDIARVDEQPELGGVVRRPHRPRARLLGRDCIGRPQAGQVEDAKWVGRARRGRRKLPRAVRRHQRSRDGRLAGPQRGARRGLPQPRHCAHVGRVLGRVRAPPQQRRRGCRVKPRCIHCARRGPLVVKRAPPASPPLPAFKTPSANRAAERRRSVERRCTWRKKQWGPPSPPRAGGGGGATLVGQRHAAPKREQSRQEGAVPPARAAHGCAFSISQPPVSHLPQLAAVATLLTGARDAAKSTPTA